MTTCSNAVWCGEELGPATMTQDAHVPYARVSLQAPADEVLLSIGKHYCTGADVNISSGKLPKTFHLFLTCCTFTRLNPPNSHCIPLFPISNSIASPSTTAPAIMSAPTTARMMRQITRTIASKPLSRALTQQAPSRLSRTPRAAAVVAATNSQARFFSVSRPTLKGLQPDQEEPQPKVAEANDHIVDPTPIEEAEYHEHAEKLLEEIVVKIEELQESREDVDADYSVSFVKKKEEETVVVVIAVIYKHILMPSAGWSFEHYFSPQRHLCPQQAAPEQANLALVAHLRP